MAKCGLAAEQIGLKLSIVGILVLMTSVGVSATGTNIYKFFYRDLLLLLFALLLLLPRTRNERNLNKKKFP
jgi:hypothetical protein